MSTTEQHTGNSETARVVARPPLLFIGAILVGFVMDHVLPIPVNLPKEEELLYMLDQQVPLPFNIPKAGEIVHKAIPSIPLFFGLVFFVAGIGHFLRSGTPVQSSRPVKELVTSGIYEWSRNPIYVGLFLVYLGIGMAVRSPWIILLILPLLGAIRFGAIAREETYLEDRFGDYYRDYKSRVRRWI